MSHHFSYNSSPSLIIQQLLQIYPTLSISCVKTFWWCNTIWKNNINVCYVRKFIHLLYWTLFEAIFISRSLVWNFITNNLTTKYTWHILTIVFIKENQYTHCHKALKSAQKMKGNICFTMLTIQLNMTSTLNDLCKLFVKPINVSEKS